MRKKPYIKGQYKYENFIITILVIAPICIGLFMFLLPNRNAEQDLALVLTKVQYENSEEVPLSQIFTWNWGEMCVTNSLAMYPKLERRLYNKSNRFLNPSTHFDYLIFDQGETYFQNNEIKSGIFIEGADKCYARNDLIRIRGQQALWVNIIEVKED